MPPPGSRARRGIALLLRFGVAALGLLLAFRIALASSDEGLVSSLTDAWQVPAVEAFGWFAVAWLLLGISLVVGAVRFRGLLRGAGLDVAMLPLLRAYLVATFFNQVLPGGMLGDVYRFWDARRDTGEGARVLGVVVLERLLSLAALGAVALAVAPALPSIENDRQLLIALVLAGGVFVLGAFAVLLPPVSRLLMALASRIATLSQRLGSALSRSLDALSGAASRPGVILAAFGWSLLNQGLPIAAVVVLAVPLDALVAWHWFAVIVPFVTLVSLLPVSVGGTGVRELLYVSLFGAVGMRPESALALSLSVLAAALLWGLVGLAVFALGRSGDASGASSRPHPAES